MYRSGTLFLLCCFVAVCARKTVQRPHCSRLETPVIGFRRRDVFCKPYLTRPGILYKQRDCLCKKNYVRNAWGICITKNQCRQCKHRVTQDFNSCGSACPLTCNRQIPWHCPKHCVAGCACPPGYVRNPRNRKKACISAASCPPRCPKYSSFQLCVSNCQLWCNRRRPKHCFTSCLRGDCVCRKGYAKRIQRGQVTCVPRSQCPHHGNAHRKG
ncbi:uncharacterized protein LOC144142467 [Haemaphysalis longicornis]